MFWIFFIFFCNRVRSLTTCLFTSLQSVFFYICFVWRWHQEFYFSKILLFPKKVVHKWRQFFTMRLSIIQRGQRGFKGFHLLTIPKYFSKCFRTRNQCVCNKCQYDCHNIKIVKNRYFIIVVSVCKNKMSITDCWKLA